MSTTTRSSTAARIAWCLYNFGVAAWPVVIATFVWGTYFSTAILGTPNVGAERWGEALSGAGLVVAVLGPVLGAIADRTGRRKPWLAVFAAAAVAATALLWFSVPEPRAAVRTLGLVALASIAYEFGLIFYNAMLRNLVPLERLGRLSGWGWGLGYVGGLACLSIALFALVKAPTPPFGLAAVPAGPVRATALLVAFWFALFTLPLFFFVPDRVLPPIALGRAVGEGLKDLGASLRGLMRERNMLRFLLARMIYADGLNTLFIFGGIYAAGEIGLSLEEVIRFAILINASAGAGALLLAWVDDRSARSRPSSCRLRPSSPSAVPCSPSIASHGSGDWASRSASSWARPRPRAGPSWRAWCRRARRPRCSASTRSPAPSPPSSAPPSTAS